MRALAAPACCPGSPESSATQRTVASLRLTEPRSAAQCRPGGTTRRPGCHADEVESVRAELQAFYDAEALERSRPPASGRRVDLLRSFVDLLDAEGRSKVLDIGAGPGTDAAAFANAGLSYVGVDLASNNAFLAQSRGHQVIAASLFALPFRRASFDAGWCISTLMHVPEREISAAIRAMLDPLVHGSPLAIGLWGGDGREFVTEPNAQGRRRLFSLRSADRNRELIATHCVVEHFETWTAESSGWEYHFAVARTA